MREINLIKNTCNIMPKADPDIFGELHHDNYRAINCTATLFVNLLFFCSGGIYATINIIPVSHYTSDVESETFYVKYFSLSFSATFTSIIKTGTSTSGPITAAKACPEFIPKTAIETAIANSKLLLEAVKARVAVFL